MMKLMIFLLNTKILMKVMKLLKVNLQLTVLYSICDNYFCNKHLAGIKIPFAFTLYPEGMGRVFLINIHRNSI